MRIPRLELLEKLNRVAPALSDKELIPVLTHLWFQGSTVMAFNDQIAIQTRLQTDFTGAVPGKILLELLTASRAPNVSFTVKDDGDTLLVQAKQTKISLKLLPADKFIFEMPKPTNGGKGELPGDKDFLPAIECCMQSISNDTSIPDQLGLTIIPNGTDLQLYTVNNMTLNHAKVKGTLPGRVILSKPFCQQLLELTKNATSFRLLIQPDHAMATFDNGQTRLFGRLIDSSHPVDFDALMKAHLPDRKLELFAIPTSLKLVLQRALVITETKMEETKSLIQVKDGVMSITSKSAKGELVDTVQDQNAKLGNHPDISVRLNPRLLKNGLQYDKLLVTESCAIMTKKNMVYLISASND
jgi:DNA polymerase III sliding clamp (beta) subunit (PCNA family)